MLARTLKRIDPEAIKQIKKKDVAQKYIFLPLAVISVILMILLVTKVRVLYWTVTIAWTVGWMAALWFLSRKDWLRGTPDEVEFRTGKFCEEVESVRLAQPVNTLSNMGFVVLGLLIVLLAGTRSAPAANPMADRGTWVPLVYGLSVIFLGPGSMFFHASGKKWAGWFDTVSMVGWAGYSLSYTASLLLTRWFGWSQVTLPILAVLIIGGIGIVTLWRDLPNFRSVQPQSESAEKEKGGLDEIFWVAVVWVLVEAVYLVLIVSGSTPVVKRSISWLVAAFIAFGAAFVCWIPSNGIFEIVGIQRQWCRPRSWYQGHAFWHLFSAIGALMVYFYFVSEV